MFGVVLLLAAVLMFFHPTGSAAALAVIFAIVALVAGVKSIWVYRKLSQEIGYRSFTMLIGGAIEILLALLFLFKIHAGIFTIGILFAVWILVYSICQLIVVDHVRKFNGGIFCTSLIFDLITLFLGFFLLLDPNLAAKVLAVIIGIILLVAGINMIMLAFVHRL
ncbi:DUF308 domain-containing protein [Fructilactobacillus fructivorans]|uniref:DUF308 domain-containing protein n=1 Tax=Fructilactobacillus fructivorans TaxID=1614 RepID=UPI0023529162|nr:DUF308 domain-containing protein [Fructilactobacillus fructivorans]